MTDVGTARVRVTGDTKRLEQDIERGTTRATKDAGVKGGKSLGSNLARGFVAAGAGALIASEIDKQINAASDLGETISKTGKVFGDASAEVEAWSDTTADGIGQSKRAALEAASSFGIFGKAAGLSGGELVGFSTKLTGLASDLASLNNTSPEEAVQALGAALRGESEPIRRYGVLLDDATLRQEALAQGLISTTKDALTPQQRVLAAQAQIFKQTSTAQGDFADTSDGLANSQRILAANLEDARAELGEQWLPIALKATEAGTDLLKAFSDAPTPLRNATIGIGLLAGATLLLAPRIAATVEALKAMGGAFSTTSVKAAVSAGVFAASAAVIGAIATEAISASENLARLDDGFDPVNIDEYRASIGLARDQLKAFEDNSGSVFEKAGRGWAAISHAATGHGNILNDLREKYIDASGVLADYEFIIRGLSLQYNTADSNIRSVAESVFDQNKSFDENKAAIEAAARASAGAASTTTELGEAQAAANDAFATGTDKANAYKDALDALNAPALDIRASQRAYQDAVDDASAALKENGRTLDINTEAGRTNAATLDAVAKAAMDTAAVLREKDGDDKRANETLATAQTRLEKQAEAFGLSKKEAKKYVDQVLDIPPRVNTDVTASTTEATETIQRFISKYDKRRLKMFVTVDGPKLSFGLGNGRIPGSAQGDTYTSPTPRWVGEQGPELFVPNRAGTIVPNYAIDDLGSASTNVGVRVFIGDRELTDIVRTEVTHSEDDLALALSGGSL
jgi:hypothetical protein